MKYVLFFNDGKNRYLYYGEDDKIYEHTQNTPNYKLGGRYLIIFTIVSILLRSLDMLFQNFISSVYCIGLILFASIFSIIVGAKIFQANTSNNKLKLREISLTKEQFEKYISVGKQQFIKQLWVSYILIILPFIAFGYFAYTQKLSILICGMLITLVATFMIMTSTPLKKYRFFKNFSKGKK